MPRERATCKPTASREWRHNSPPSTPRQARSDAGPCAAVVVIVLLGIAAYSNSLRGAFVFDDDFSIADNDSIRSLQRLRNVLSPVEHLDYYRPMLNLSLALCYWVGGLDVLPYHVLNLTIHIAAALTLFGLVRRSLLLGPDDGDIHVASTSLALAATVLWMLHPLQTESVTYVVQRCEAMFGLFCLMSLYCVLRGATSSRASWWYVGAVAACALGMGSKETMAVAPLLILLYDRIFLSASWREVLRKRWGLYAALVVTAGILVPMLSKSRLCQSERVTDPTTVGEYARTQFSVVVHYLRLSVWPDRLCLDYQWPVAELTWGLLPPIACVSFLLVSVLWALRRWPRWGFLGAWFFLVLAPTSSIIPIPDLAFEHRMYLPLAPLAISVVLGFHLAARSLVKKKPYLRPLAKWASIGLAAGLAAVLGILTYLRNEDYGSALSIYQDTVAKAPNNYRAHNNLGRALELEGRLEEAAVHFVRALEINPELENDLPETKYNIALMMIRLGRTDEAVRRLEEVLKTRGDDIETHLNLGVALSRLNRIEEAIEHYHKALGIDPRFAPAHNNLGNILLQLGRVDEAVVHYRAAVDINADDAEYQNNLAMALHQTRRDREAVLHLRESLRLQPDQAAVLLQIAWVLATSPDESVRDGNDAVRLAERAIQLSGRSSAAELDVLGAAYAEAGRFSEAVATARRALALVPADRPELAHPLRDRIAGYEAGCAFRELQPVPRPEGGTLSPPGK